MLKDGANDYAQGQYYKNIVQDILDCKAVTSLTWWGTNDGASWRSSDKPLMFDSSYQPKAAFNAVVGLVPPELWGKTNGSDDPDPQPGKNTYPANIMVETNSTYHQIRFTWDSVSGADRYGIAVYLAGKWRIQTQSLTSTSYTTPKNMTPGKTYKVAVAARVNGTWDVAGAVKNAVTVTVR